MSAPTSGKVRFQFIYTDFFTEPSPGRASCSSFCAEYPTAFFLEFEGRATSEEAKIKVLPHAFHSRSLLDITLTNPRTRESRAINDLTLSLPLANALIFRAEFTADTPSVFLGLGCAVERSITKLPVNIVVKPVFEDGVFYQVHIERLGNHPSDVSFQATIEEICDSSSLISVDRAVVNYEKDKAFLRSWIEKGDIKGDEGYIGIEIDDLKVLYASYVSDEHKMEFITKKTLCRDREMCNLSLDASKIVASHRRTLYYFLRRNGQDIKF